MTRQQFIRLLTTAVQNGWITEADALSLRARYDAGTLDTSALPLPPQEAMPVVTFASAAVLAAPFLALRLLAASLPVRAAARDRMQDVFETRVQTLTPLPVQRWHLAMRDSVSGHLLAQFALGLGRPLRVADLPLISRDLTIQHAYLSRFADERAARVLTGIPISDARVGARSQLYSGSGRAAWFTANESTLTGGWVSRYEARDDGHVCSPCLAAEQGSPYLPARGPVPGSACLGKGRCRCVRVPIYDPVAFRRLGGMAA